MLEPEPIVSKFTEELPSQNGFLERPSSCGLRLSKCEEMHVIWTQDLDTVFLQVRTSPRL